VTGLEAEHVRTHCPCGAAVERVEHVFGEGVCDGHGVPAKITRQFWAALYFSDPAHGGTGTEFCSAGCADRWNREFWEPWRRHRDER